MKESSDAVNKPDRIVRIGRGSIVQHGKLNDRVYLMKLIPQDAEYVIDAIAGLAARYNYSKLFCKIPARTAPLFLAAGYLIEGRIPGFYNYTEDAFFVSKFLDPARAEVPTSRLRAFQQFLDTTPGESSQLSGTDGYTLRRLAPSEAEAAVALFSEVFSSYPFPIYDPGYIRETMSSGHIQYFGAFKEGELAAISSAEIDAEAENAEMTDFATRQMHLGHNLSRLLLELMENEMQRQGVGTLYTIARLNSIPMNKTFLRHGYRYAGTLVNNTQIAGAIESMNLWYKSTGV